MHIRDFSFFNLRRCIAERGFNHPLHSWSPSDWITALVGEVGEAANIVKKLNRIRDGLGSKNLKGETGMELREALAKEIGDAYAYLDLFAQSVGMSLEDCAIDKWDEVSKKIGYPTRLRALEKSFAGDANDGVPPDGRVLH